jgi:hypothetical protein
MKDQWTSRRDKTTPRSANGKPTWAPERRRKAAAWKKLLGFEVSQVFLPKTSPPRGLPVAHLWRGRHIRKSTSQSLKFEKTAPLFSHKPDASSYTKRRGQQPGRRA